MPVTPHSPLKRAPAQDSSDSDSSDSDSSTSEAQSLDKTKPRAKPTPPESDVEEEISIISSVDERSEEFELLDDEVHDTLAHGGHELKTAPLVTREAYASHRLENDIVQYGVLGKILGRTSQGSCSVPQDSRLYVNTNAPLSTFICGVQGSGKSHTVSVLLENMFIRDYFPIGELVNPLSGLVLHFGETGSAARPCEAAFVGRSDLPGVKYAPSVVVYVSPSSLKRMTKLYESLGKSVRVRPLYFEDSELDAAAFLSLMAVSSSDSAPLYMHVLLSILRGLGDKFSTSAFLRELESKKANFNPGQLSSLQQRLDLLQTFMKPRGVESLGPRFKRARITIMDLSDPFIDSASACGIFEVVLRQFERADVGTGKVLLVDEAHKYLSQTKTATGLTKSLLTLIRQQRHMSMRVIISTQEPTVVPSVFIDLCSVVILHRFQSLAWWDQLSKHVSADLSVDGTFDMVTKLKTGQAIVIAPAGVGMVDEVASETGNIVAGSNEEASKPKRILAQFGRRYLLVKTRKRITMDGGTSLLAVPVEA
ncbi:hypothetical protein EVG20_g3065 [Dentipellis fragilis]|uniref:Zona occludens toxin N-terminal domain-containing protein n=1 Tax=Dentipellis fragilis TaxID=205917 RepID=A0A4Y9Z6X5_9AGAM|nr:hypothetical protein EVG20_g3065 [Dentipellis fragilis]